jgi:F-type H+-transporting ATPase subunit alpha
MTKRLCRQKQYQPMGVEEQVPLIYAGVNGHLDNIPVSKIQQFETDFTAHLKANEADLLNKIVTEGALSKELEGKLKDATVSFVKSFL